MTTCREFFTFSWPLRGREGGGQPKRSGGQAWPLFTSFFFAAFPYIRCVSRLRWALLWTGARQRSATLRTSTSPLRACIRWNRNCRLGWMRCRAGSFWMQLWLPGLESDSLASLSVTLHQSDLITDRVLTIKNNQSMLFWNQIHRRSEIRFVNI